MTDYRIVGVTTDDESGIAVQLAVGKRSSLEPIALTRRQAWGLVDRLLWALRTQEPTS